MADQTTYTVEEVAETLRVDPQTVRRYLSGKSLNGWKLRRFWRIDQKELDRFIRDQKGRGNASPA